MAMGHGRDAPFTTWCPAAKARHLGGCAGFVDEHKLSRFEVKLAIEPSLPRRPYIVALLLRGMRCLFLNVMSRLSKKCQTVEVAA